MTSTSTSTSASTSTMMMEATNNKVNRVSNFNEDSIKHFCRVCTSNPYKTSKKIRPEDQNIGIFKKIGLKSILEKFLQLEISENDPLPKTICKKCFDKLMAVEFLQVLAKRSEQLFKDVLTNRSEKIITIDESYKNTSNIIPPARKLTTTPDEVIVDVTMSDPLTKDIKKKLQVAQNKRDSIGLAFHPDNLNRNAITSSPIPQVPVTIVHRMPKKRKPLLSPPEPKQLIEIPPQVQSNPPVPIHLHANTTTVTLEKPYRITYPAIKSAKMNPTSPLRHISEVPVIPQNVEIHPVVTGNSQPMGNGMPLGSIIKDVDLLKLILKALKWPYNNQTLDIQIERLKSTNFNDIIVDPNLLQDTDLIQILGPLLNPLPVTMQQQTYHITVPPETLDVPPTTMSYKLPAETSVQIITVPAAEKEKEKEHQQQQQQKQKQLDRKYHRSSSSKRHSMKNSVIRKKSDSNRPKLPTSVIVLSDSDDEHSQRSNVNANEEISSFHGVQLDPAVYPGVGENSNSNEAMLATLNRQREAMMRMHRSKRKQSLSAKNVEMVDDIMIVDEGYHMDEPYPDVVLVKKSQGSHDVQTSAHSKSSSRKSLSDVSIQTPKKDITMHLQSNPSTSMKIIPRAPDPRGYVKLKEESHLPPLKKVKVLSTNARSYVQLNDPSRVPFSMSKQTTVADADSTTKIAIKDSKVSQSTPSFEGKIPKAVSTENQKNEEKKQLNSAEQMVVVELEEFNDEERDKQNPVQEKKKHLPIPRSKTKKDRSGNRNFKILATFDISDDDAMESPQTKPGDVKGTPEVEKKQTEKTDSSLQTLSSESIVNESSIEIQNESTTIETPNESKEEEADPVAEQEDKPPTSLELPEIDIKTEQNEDVKVKKEDPESIDDAQTTKTTMETKRSQRNFVASKTAIKTEFIKSTRSASKRKIVPKLEEQPIEITNFRPARRSKTLSKYYKGPPLSGTEGRSMRSRT